MAGNSADHGNDSFPGAEPARIAVKLLTGAHASRVHAVDAGPIGGGMSCGRVKGHAMCAWADQDVAVVLEYVTDVTDRRAASLTLAFRDAITVVT